MKILYILYYLLILSCLIEADNKVRIYEKIPKNFVATTVYNFLKDNNINNCFSFQESNTQLLLKCWRNNNLVNAEINIYDKNDKQRLYYTHLSVVI